MNIEIRSSRAVVEDIGWRLPPAFRVMGVMLCLVMSGWFVACNGGSSAANPNPSPATGSLDPSSATAGGAAFTLIVEGSNFGAKVVVNWNGAAQTANLLDTLIGGSILAVGDIA